MTILRKALIATSIAGAVFLGGTVAASAAVPGPHAIAVMHPADKPKSYSYTGDFSPRDNPHWSLTGSDTITPGSEGPFPMFMLPKTKGFANQEFFAGMTLGIGEIGYLPFPQLRVSKRIATTPAQLIDETSANPRYYTWVLGFREHEGSWYITVTSGKKLLYLTVPSHLTFSKKKAIQSTWSKLAAPGGKVSQLWTINWKENEVTGTCSVSAAQPAAQCAPGRQPEDAGSRAFALAA